MTQAADRYSPLVATAVHTMEAMTVSEARRILGVQPDASASAVNKAYRASALRNHPDKGGDEEVMKLVGHAYQLLTGRASTAASSSAAAQHPNPAANRWTRAQHTVSKASPAPCYADREEALAQAEDFLRRLSQSKRAEMKAFRNSWIKRVITNPLWPGLIEYFVRCLEVLAGWTNRAIAAHGVQSWEAIGFKELSHKGFDVRRNNQKVDYGNAEYLAVLQFLALADTRVWVYLKMMRRAWPTYMDLWAPNKTNAHVEQLADVVEIVIAALRGESYFAEVVHEISLRDLLPVLTSVCQLVHHFNGHLCTGECKYNGDRLLNMTRHLPPMLFITNWNDYANRGLLLYSIFKAFEP